MIKLNVNDKIAVVSLSSGILGESFCKHQLDLGTQRLKEFNLQPVFMPNSLKGFDFIKDNPEARAQDLLKAFADPEIKGILCAIGGFDTYRIAPYILNDEAAAIIQNNPKFFMGFSDSTIDHLMLYKLGINSFYGLSFLTCFAEFDMEMLTYSQQSFANIFTDDDFKYQPSKVWYEERTDFSPAQIGTARLSHPDTKGYQLLKGSSQFTGHLIGGCIESLYALLSNEDCRIINNQYGIFPPASAFENAVLFLETSEMMPEPATLEIMLNTLNNHIDFSKLNGLLVGKPQNEKHFEAYKEIYKRIIPNHVPVVYNCNFGHAYPKMLLQYGALASVNVDKQQIDIARL